MILYNPSNIDIINKRIEECRDILFSISAKHCFITGSFLYKKDYKDIDVFVISRTKKEIKADNPKVNIIKIDFNDLYSLFYHSVSKSCIAKNILPKKQLKITFADYWNIINEAVPCVLNNKKAFRKEIRFVVLYTEYFKTSHIFDSFELMDKISKFRNYKEFLNYLSENIPGIIAKHIKRSYIKRYFYTQAGSYKDLFEYDSHRYLYDLAHKIIEKAV
ncbi:MAG: hypothetical protein KAS15_02190 [Nanoarchaeota archaeon]|nr:hypothetical protein [Nanoarchaeota archaeon]